MKRIDPRLRVLYLVALAVGVFFLRSIPAVLGVALVQAASWLLVGLPARRLGRQVVKLWGFTLFILATYAFTADDPALARWVRLSLGGFALPINLAGLEEGGLMVLRVLAVVVGSQVARAGDSRAIAAGLGKLGMPLVPAASIDTVLALLGDEEMHGRGMGRGRGGGRGGGGGGGGGRGRHREDEAAKPQEGFFAGVRRLGRGDIGPLVRRMERHIRRAERHAEEHGLGERGKDIARDVGVIAGIALTMLGIKALKILPSIPFAPGHKLVLLTPLYIVAAILTRARLGAALTGLVMGTVAFLMGDGRYGIFEIAKHVTPGLFCDALVPFMLRGGRVPGAFAWSLAGGVIAAGRFATIFLVTLAVQAPSVAYAILLPGLSVHLAFGVFSGAISRPLVRAALALGAERAQEPPDPSTLETSPIPEKEAT